MKKTMPVGAIVVNSFIIITGLIGLLYSGESNLIFYLCPIAFFFKSLTLVHISLGFALFTFKDKVRRWFIYYQIIILCILFVLQIIDFIMVDIGKRAVSPIGIALIAKLTGLLLYSSVNIFYLIYFTRPKVKEQFERTK